MKGIAFIPFSAKKDRNQMNIGLTYDLKSEYLAMGYSAEETAEFDRDDTITALEEALRAKGHETDRIGNAKRLVARLAGGDRWDLVFNIAEGLHGIGREAQVPAILDLYQIPYTFSDPLVMSLSLHKGMTKQVVAGFGFPTAAFLTAETAADARRVSFDPPYFIKPVAEGTSKGVTPDSVIRDRKHLEAACAEMIRRFDQPVLVERYLPGREFTTGILGTGGDAKILGTMEVRLSEEADSDFYSYENKIRYEEVVRYDLARPENDPVVAAAENLALGIWRALGCRDAGRMDFRCDASGRPVFLEVNPLAGLNPHHSDLPILCRLLNLPYADLIHAILASAEKRVATVSPPNGTR